MTRPRQIEQAISALTVVGIAVFAWMPLLVQARERPYVSWILVPASLAMALFGLALVYEVAERMLGRGRGIYATAVFCTAPGVGLAATDPAAMQLVSLLIFNAAAVFLASRARGEERPYFLAMLALLLFAAGALFDFTPAFAFWAAIPLAVADVGRRRTQALLTVCLVLVYAVSAKLRLFVDLPLPQFTLGESGLTLASGLSLLPWMLWTIPAMARLRLFEAGSWWREVALLALLPLPLIALFRENLTAVSVAFAPALALLTTHLLHEDLTAGRAASKMPAIMLPSLLTALVLLVMSLLSVTGVLAKPVIGTGHVAAGVILAVALAWTTLSRLHRWAFFLLAATGLYFALLIAQREPLLPTPMETVAPVPLSFFVFVLAGALAAGATATLIQRRLFPSGVKEPDEARLFGGENFRRFAASETSAAAPANLRAPFSFAVFGDVAGAESPFATRHGGFLMFRNLARTLKETSPAFAVSLGDLAREASSFAYRRLRRLLRGISVPLMVTPGNHDVFLGKTYDARHFHSLFGADNAAFDLGAVRFVLLNNAYGFVSEEQFAWLEGVLSDQKPFTLVFCHKPVFEQREGVFYAMETREHAERLHELFRARGVTAVFSGHIHSLLHEERDGVTYVVSGGGGSKPVAAADRYHYLRVDASDGDIIVRALPLDWKRLPAAAPLLELRLTPRS